MYRISKLILDWKKFKRTVKNVSFSMTKFKKSHQKTKDHEI